MSRKPHQAKSRDQGSPESTDPSHLLRAGIDGWELWRQEGGRYLPQDLPTPPESEQQELPQLPEGTALAIPLRQTLSLRLDLPAPEGVNPLEALPLELEALGLIHEGDLPSWSAQALGAAHGQGEDRHQQVLVILPTEEALDLARELHAPEALSAAWTLPLPANGFSLWRELGRPVCAVTRGSQLIHSQSLGSSHWDRAAALEIRAISRALQTEGIAADPLDKIQIWDRESAEPAFIQALGFEPLHCGLLPAPIWPDETVPRPQLPHLLEAATSSQKKRRLKLIALAVAALVLLWFSFGIIDWAGLRWQKFQLERELTELGPRAEILTETDSTFIEVIEPLLLQNQPLELFRVVRRLQPSGVRLERFTASPQSLELQGTAAAASDALELQRRLESESAFSGWSWENKSPNLDASGSAAFRFNATRK